MQIEISQKAQEHLLFWQKTGNKAILKKIDQITDRASASNLRLFDVNNAIMKVFNSSNIILQKFLITHFAPKLLFINLIPDFLN